MADPIHHALSSVRRWGGVPEDYLAIHEWFDATKEHYANFRHRAARHHSEGIGQMIATFGTHVVTADGKLIPTRWVGEQHVLEDLGRIPTLADWLCRIQPEPWMGRDPVKLSTMLANETDAYLQGR